MIDLTTDRGQQQYQAVITRLWSRLERPMVNKLRIMLNRQYNGAATLLENGIENIDSAVDQLAPVLRQVLVVQYRKVFNLAHRETHASIEAVEREAASKAVEMEAGFTQAMSQFTKTNVAKNVRLINLTTKKVLDKAVQKGIRDAVQQGISAGSSYGNIAKDIRKLKGITTNWRANMIARTETHQAFNFATDKAIEGTGRPHMRIWSSTLDARTRLTHLQANKQRRKQNETFLVGGEHLKFPGDQQGGSAKNVVNCRCSLLYNRRLGEELARDRGPVITVPPVSEPVPTEQAWAPTMTEEEAELWLKDSKMKDTVFHGTSSENAAKITKEGFDSVKLGSTTGNSGYFGQGHYFTQSKAYAQTYADLHKTKQIMQLKVRVRKPIYADTELFEKLDDAALDKAVKAYEARTGEIVPKYGELRSKIYMQDAPKVLTEDLKKLGYDGVIAPANKGLSTGAGGAFDEIVVFDRKNITTVTKDWRKVKPKAPKGKPMTSSGNLINCVIEGKGKSVKSVKPDPCKDYVRIGEGKKAEWFLRGKKVTGSELKALEDMKIPPAWQQAVVSTDKAKKVQAIGQDRAGRWQYRYSEDHIEQAAKKKFMRQKQFASDMPDVRKGIARDMDKGDLRAYLFDLEDKTAIRVGSDVDFKAKKKAYGLTTLQKEHAVVKGDTILLDFTAKEGIRAQYELKDKKLASWLSERIKVTKKGEQLFPDVNAKKLNDYLKNLAGGKKYTVKDFRTYHGTRIAHDDLKQYAGQELTKKRKEEIIKEVSKRASDFLANTPVMARKSYINPVVWDFIGGL